MSSITAALAKRAVKNLPFTTQGISKPWALVKSIGIIYNGKQPGITPLISMFVQHLKSQQKQVHQLVYWPLNSKKEEVPASVLGIDYLTSHHLDWRGLPKSQSAPGFLNTPFDILFDLNVEAIPALQWISRVSPAHLKVGILSDTQPQLHLQIEVPESSITEKVSIFMQHALPVLANFR